MGQFMSMPDLVTSIQTLSARLDSLERAFRPAPSYTTAGRPAPAAVPGLIILNTTTGKHEGSNGTAWTALY